MAQKRWQAGFSKALLDSLKTLTEAEIEERRQRFEKEREARKEHTRAMKRAGIWF